MTTSLFFQLLVNGLALGLLYILIVLGIDVIMRVTRLVNFAHGQFFMVGAYVFFYSFVTLQSIGSPAWCSLGSRSSRWARRATS